jgi:hypothetical protein
LTSTLAQRHDKDHLLRFYSANALPLILIGYRGDSHWRDVTLKYCVIVTLQGVDLAADQGTPILASDRGTITFAGWSGGYGYMVAIQHEGGFVTRYAHCCAIHAHIGQVLFIALDHKIWFVCWNCFLHVFTH